MTESVRYRAYRFGLFTLDLERETLRASDDREIPLRPKSFALLRLLVENAGRLLSREAIMEALWPDVSVTNDSLTQCIHDIRGALGPDARSMLSTRRRRGFLLASDVVALLARAEPKPPPRPSAVVDDQRRLDNGIERKVTQLKTLGVPLPDLPLDPMAHAPTSNKERPEPGPGGRRQLTALSCEVVGLAPLLESLDLEDLHELTTAWHQGSTDSIERYGGYIANYSIDGVLAYFGYPQADEDDAERAIHAALSLVEAMSKFATEAGLDLQIAVGIASGLVIASGLAGSSTPQRVTAVGGAPNLAARLKELASGDQIIIAASTRRLVENRFDLTDLGDHNLKGISEPIHAWQVKRALVTASRFEASRGSGALTPLVGREEELDLLLRRWSQAEDGEGQIVLLSGEPGIGKSRILSALRERLEARGVQALRFQCSPYNVNSPFWPIIDNFERALRFSPDETAESKLDKLEELIVTHHGRPLADVRFVAAVLSIPCEHRYGALAMMPQKHKDETLRTLVDISEAAARGQPSVLLFEDAHWADPTTLEVLDLLVDRVKTVPLLVVLTHRLEFQSRWAGQGHVGALNLTKLTRTQSAAIVSSLAGGRTLPAPLLEQILTRTDGVPLFVEELTKSILEAGELTEKGHHYEYSGSGRPVTIPATLRNSLMARLDRFTPVKEIAQIGAAIGRAFSYELIAAVAPARHAQLDEALLQLIESGLAFRRGTPPNAIYTFKHALVQEVAYESLLRKQRQHIHRRIAETMRDQLHGRANTEPEIAAHHFTQAGLTMPAVEWWGKAGELALRRCAYTEAIAHLETALQLADGLDRSDQRTYRLRLQITYGNVLRVARGFGVLETQAAFVAATSLAADVEDVSERLPAYYGLWSGSFLRGDLRPMQDMAIASLRDAATNSPDAAIAHRMSGMTRWYMGDFVTAREHLEQVLAIFGQDLASPAMVYLAQVLWLLGNLSGAGLLVERAVNHALGTKHIPTIAYAHAHAATFEMMRCDCSRTAAHLAALLSLAREHSISIWVAAGTFYNGWLRWNSGDRETGMAEMHDGMVKMRMQQQEIYMPLLMTRFAETEAEAGQPDAALATLDTQLAIIAQSGQRWFLAQVHRVRGQLLLKCRPYDPIAAETAFTHAIDVARNQRAKLFELQAAASLARLWRDRGKCVEARDLLAPIYDWFTEGFDAPDLKDAKALLDELA
jgi:class 3 adenylate cyclase/DNA-binding winged helix-turn-helix (wHTH) protein/tetratricopeptide (TPR) repeat protein